MNIPQQTLFDDLPEAETTWERCFGWKPRVGCLARIDSMIAYNVHVGHNRFAYCMRVIVRQIAKGYALCETTKSWENACMGNPTERAGHHISGRA